MEIRKFISKAMMINQWQFVIGSLDKENKLQRFYNRFAFVQDLQSDDIIIYEICRIMFKEEKNNEKWQCLKEFKTDPSLNPIRIYDDDLNNSLKSDLSMLVINMKMIQEGVK